MRIDLEDFARRLNGTVAEVEGKLARGMVVFGELVLGDAVDLCPQDTGALRRSGMSEVARDGDRLVGAVGFGTGDAAAYAVPVHERLDLYHPIGQAKFLEGALEGRRDEFLPVLRDALQ